MTTPAPPAEKYHGRPPRPAGRGRWEPPRVEDLPRLAELTLQSPSGPVIPGTCTPGSTCF